MLFSVIRSLFSGQHVDIWSVLAYVLSVLFVVIFILPLHEYAHGWAANKLGDPTAKWEGRLTMNPLASVDVVGVFMLLFAGFGWAKPVPIDSRYFKKPKRDIALTALAGPVSNLLAALIGAILVAVMESFAPVNGFTRFLFNVLYYYVLVNISLAVFNLIPIPPLDGSRILGVFLSDRAMSFYYRYQNILSLLLIVLLLTNALSGPLYAAQNFFVQVIFTVAEFPFRLAGVL